MIKAEEIISSRGQSRDKNKDTQKAVSQNLDNLKTTKNKNYNEPL